jgi:hypothetical protein
MFLMVNCKLKVFKSLKGVSVSPITELEEYTGYDAEVMHIAKAKVNLNSGESEVSNSSRHKTTEHSPKSRGDV